MFEKEAEEYLKKDGTKAESILNMLNEISPLKITLKQVPFVLAMIQQVFKDGAEFGYNKANEWHCVKDGDLPKVGQKCYFIYSNFYGKDNKVIFSESSIEVRTGVYTFILDEETGDETTETCFYDDIIDEEIYEQEVYAWKEITFPNEVKEND